MQAEIISMLIEIFGVAVVSVVAKILVRVIKEYQVEAEVKRAVKAAEILFNAPSSGEKKKQWVKDSILSVFHPQWLTEQRLEMFIEAAVAALKGFSN